MSEADFSAEDRLAIINTVNCYGHFIDAHRMDEWFALFVEGAVFEGWQGDRLLSKGLEIRERTLERRERFQREGVQRRHILMCHRFDAQTAMAASGQCYFQLYSVQNGATSLVNIGVYEYEMVKQDGRWKFQKLIVRADSGFD